MNRTAEVALTPDGKTNVNRLRVPEFTLVKLCLKIGGKASKCYFPPDAPPPKEADTGKDDFHFAPEKETVEIAYELDDACGLIETAKLELFCRFREAALWTLDLAKLGDDWLAHGKHIVKWDGRVVTPTAAEAGTKGSGGMEHDLTKLPADKDVVKDSFIDGYVTLEHTPYKFRLTLGSTKGQGRVITAWTYFQILIKSIEIDLGPEECVPAASVDDDRHKSDKAVRKRIEDDGKLPADGATRKVFLLTNVYKTGLAEMDDNTAFTQLETAWKDGPNIPVIAKIRLADSADAEVKLESDKGAVALGKAKFLWDWEDVDEDVDAQQAAANPKGFIKNAINYYKPGTDGSRSAKDHTYPKGDNCHVDRGGKRGPDAKPVFPKQDGYDPKDDLDAGKFPFVVIPAGTKEGPENRLWASYSRGWTRGKLKGQTGVVFQPSRMAGDSYKLTVYLDTEKSKKDEFVFDDKAEPLKAATAIKKSTGTFQMWREVHLARYVRKTASLAEFFPGNLAGVQAHYRMAYIELVDKMGADNSYAFSDHRLPGGAAPDYNALVRGKLSGSGSIWFTADLATDSAADHAAEDSMLKVRGYAEFVQKVHLNLNTGVAAAANDFSYLAGCYAMSEDDAAEILGSYTASGFSAWTAADEDVRLEATENWLISNAAETAAKYAEALDNWGFGFGEPLANDFKIINGGKNGVGTKAPPGVTFMEFNYTNTCLRDLNVAGAGLGYWYGAAIDPTDASRDSCMIMFWLAGKDEFSHEYGHHMFLPHACSTSGAPAGVQHDKHDDTDLGCLMSYSAARPGFCGLCQLRMRGWDATALKKTSADNKKP